jgi:hypothetical protein
MAAVDGADSNHWRRAAENGQPSSLAGVI